MPSQCAAPARVRRHGWGLVAGAELTVADEWKGPRWQVQRRWKLNGRANGVASCGDGCSSGGWHARA